MIMRHNAPNVLIDGESGIKCLVFGVNRVSFGCVRYLISRFIKREAINGKHHSEASHDDKDHVTQHIILQFC